MNKPLPNQENTEDIIDESGEEDVIVPKEVTYTKAFPKRNKDIGKGDIVIEPIRKSKNKPRTKKKKS